MSSAVGHGYARDGRWRLGAANVLEMNSGLGESAITRGRSDDERITSVATFGGFAFKPPPDAIRILTFGTGSISAETTKAPEITPGRLSGPAHCALNIAASPNTAMRLRPTFHAAPWHQSSIATLGASAWA